MIQTGDLLPRSSGIAHLGVDAGGVDSFDASSITPYGHIHMNSGVFHDPASGQSGVFRFNLSLSRFEISVDGGKSFAAAGSNTQTLQDAYENGNEITVGANGNLIFNADTNKTNFQTNGSVTPIRITPIVDPPNASLSVGDIWMHAHGDIVETLGLGAAAVLATSLGPATPAYNTGSGLINVMYGSGIAQYSAALATDIPTGAGITVPFDTVNFHDSNYAIDDTNAALGSGIKIFSPGLYMLHFNCSYDNDTSNSRHIIESDILINTTVLRPSSAYSYHRIPAHGEGTGAATCLAELNATDVVRVRARYIGSATSNAVQTIADECWIIIQRIGPKRQS